MKAAAPCPAVYKKQPDFTKAREAGRVRAPDYSFNE